MPELPEVEYAARRAREAIVGRAIHSVRTLHAAHRRALPDEHAASLVGEIVRGVTRRGKHQILELSSGRSLHVHFRMTGDWKIEGVHAALPRHARVVIELTGGVRLVLDDSRALASITLHARGEDPLPELGPDATDPRFTGAGLAESLRGRRAPIKPVLLDQRIVAGVGNIYASEALWRARVDPRRSAETISQQEVRRVVTGIRRAIAVGLAAPERYYGGDGSRGRFKVYGREGEPCARCRCSIARLVQSGRSTYYCPSCQR